MTQEGYNKVKQKYEQLINIRKTLSESNEIVKSLNLRKNILEQDDNVKEYISIINRLNYISELEKNYELYSNEEIVEIISQELFNEVFTNNIFVLMGKYKIVKNQQVIAPTPDDYDFTGYLNIELPFMKASVNISKQTEDVMKDSTILIAPEGIETSQFYYKVRNEFFNVLLNYGQEAAVKYIYDTYVDNKEMRKALK